MTEGKIMEATIPTRRLGRSGLSVSRLCLGTMQFGARMTEADAKRLVDIAFERGVNFIDTADVYVTGISEEICGRAIGPKRDQWIVATKLGNAMGEGPYKRGLSRRWIMEAAHASLKRLAIDTIDILYLHREDLQTPLEETVRAVADLQRSGAIRYFGLSNFQAWRIARVCDLCDQLGIDRPIVDQPVYHALNREIERDVLPACDYFGLGIFAYSPNARGVLSGKYTPGAAPPPDSRAGFTGDGSSGLYKRMMQAEFRPENVAAAKSITAYAAKRGIDPTAFALAWVLAHPNLTGAIVGPRTLEQFESYLAAFAVDWTPEDDAAVDAIVVPGTTAVPHFRDPAYPLEGRRVR
jgi:aryl-alcohol dehydrogenase-like predicted oxidoreductase